jgi:uncharacterized membrane protein
MDLPCPAWDSAAMARNAPLRPGPRWYRPASLAHSIALRPRVYWAVIAGAAAYLLLPATISANLRAAITWDVGAVLYLVLGFRLMRTCTGEQLRARAARQDDSRAAILVIVLLAIAASFWAIAGVLGEAKQIPSKALHVSLAVATIFLSWMVTQVVFTFHYAHEYYRPDEGEALAQGLNFPGDGQPDYWDFFYFATSFGAASQTSDVSIRSKALRRLTTLHAVIAFFFNTAVLALAINIGASLI